MDLAEKDTSSGRDMRTYYFRTCEKRVDAENGVAFWQVLRDPARGEMTRLKVCSAGDRRSR